MIELFLLGGPLMYPLLICLIVAVIIVIERSIFWGLLASRRKPKETQLFLQAIAQNDDEKIKLIAKKSKDVLVGTLDRLKHYSKDQLSFAMDMEVTKSFGTYKKYSNLLDTVISISPLIGILGTVVGIIASFQNMALTGMEDPKAITGGIGQALITTASGLGIAIFSLLWYNYFNSKIERISEETEAVLSQLETIKHQDSTSFKEAFAKKVTQEKLKEEA